MNKNCTNCHKPFDITTDDSAFYVKMKVPEPTLCPDCRMQRLMCFRNERALFKTKCALTGKEILSIYPPTAKATVYDQKVWMGDQWSALSYGQDFDFTKPFFDQFSELYFKVPRINLDNTNNENSDYCNDTSDQKNSYLCFNMHRGEDLYYCTTGGYGKDCVDLFWCIQCELCYECTKTFESYHCFWCFNSSNLSDCYFCEDSYSCKNCFGCIGLHQKEYHVYNKPVSRAQFEQFISEFKFTHQNIKKAQDKLSELRLQVPHKNLEIAQSEDCLGDYITNSKNCTQCFDVMHSQDAKYVWDAIVNDSYDCFNTGSMPATSLMYQCVGVYNSTNVKFCFRCDYCNDVNYCDYCSNCHDCFGCIGLKHKSYCILNKQYSKQQYEELLPRILEPGEFLPAKLNAVGYNDSVAQYYMPLSREKAIAQGFNWNDYESPKLDLESLDAKDLPDSIEEVSDDILNKRIKCEKDQKYFRITAQELAFYKKHKISLPHLCHDCRHFARKAKMNPRVLYDGHCANCQTAFKTTYSPARSEKVYCEKCYFAELA
ncbi:MAG: hypothetical protein AAB373_06040 [Patescibacteria group bacterium]